MQMKTAVREDDLNQSSKTLDPLYNDRLLFDFLNDLIDYDIKCSRSSLNVSLFSIQAAKTLARRRLLSVTLTKTESMTWNRSALIMTLNLGIPEFLRAQAVGFVGGEGIVCSCKAEAGKWTYLIEMTLGSEPLCGRVGSETMVYINEAELHVRDDKMILYEE
jgi:hypothetical protein